MSDEPKTTKFGGMAASQESYDRETERYAELGGKCKHYCPDWDFMAIDETCSEWDACLCFGKEFFVGERDAAERYANANPP